MNRIAIIGTSGSGKTTLGKLIAKELKLPFVELDRIIFKGEEFEKPPVEVYRKMVESAMTDKDKWVIEGVFPKIADIVWVKADVLIWLDIPFKEIRKQHDKRAVETGKGPAFESSFKHEREHRRLQGVYADLVKKHNIKNLLHVTSKEQDVVSLIKKLN